MSEPVEQRVKVLHDGDDEPTWVAIADYLKRYVATLVPMSVGQCFRFRMNSDVLVVAPRRTYHDAILAAELHGQASAVSVPHDGVILVLAKPVQVDVTFDGDEVFKVAGLG